MNNRTAMDDFLNDSARYHRVGQILYAINNTHRNNNNNNNNNNICYGSVCYNNNYSAYNCYQNCSYSPNTSSIINHCSTGTSTPY